jgi:hypothetical protein
MDAFIISSLPPPVVGRLLTAGLLCSPDITLVHRYYEPFRHPPAFGPFPGFTGYRTYLPPPIFPRDGEGFSSCLAHPCHRAAATTPPERTASLASLRPPVLPSPFGCGFGLRGFSLSGPPMRSLSLRPGDSLTTLKVALLMGFRLSVSLQPAIQATGLLTFAPAGLTPAECASLIWTHNRNTRYTRCFGYL